MDDIEIITVFEPELLEIDGDIEVTQLVEFETEMLVEKDQELVLLEVEPQEPSILEIATQGPPGPPGIAGGTVLRKTAGVALSALQVVYEIDGAVYPLSCTDAAHINLLAGITMTAAIQGGQIKVQRAGDIAYAGVNFLPGRVYLGLNGGLTQLPPLVGFDVLLGAATSGTGLLLNIQDPIELE